MAKHGRVGEWYYIVTNTKKVMKKFLTKIKNFLKKCLEEFLKY